MTRNTKIAIASLLVAVGIATRFLPHAWNMTPVSAIALFAAAALGLRWSLGTVVALMLVSDAVIGFYSWPVMVSVYGSFLVAALVGRAVRGRSFATVLAASIASSLFFYIVTNFAVWQWSPLYEKSLQGLVQAYIMGLPFFRNQLLGDIVYVSMFWGALALAAKAMPKLMLSRA